MKLNEAKEGCVFNDRIDIDLSPTQLSELIHLVKNDVLAENNYETQGLKRELKDILQDRYDFWKKERERVVK